MLFGWAAPEEERLATSDGTLLVHTFSGVPRVSPEPVFSRPTSRICADASLYSPLVRAMLGAVISGERDAVVVPLAAVTVTAIVRVPAMAMLLPVQVALAVPTPEPTPFVPPVDAVQVTAVMVALVKPTDIAKEPVDMAA